MLRQALAGWSVRALEQTALSEGIKKLLDLVVYAGILRQQRGDLCYDGLAAHCTIAVVPDQRAQDAQHMPLVGGEVHEQAGAVGEQVRLDVGACRWIGGGGHWASPLRGSRCIVLLHQVCLGALLLATPMAHW